MLYYEFRKIFNVKNIIVLLLLFLLSAGWFALQMRGVEKGTDTAPLQAIHEEIREMTMEEAGEYLGEKVKLIQDTLGREREMETGYRRGEIDVDEYLKYRDLFHECDARRDITERLYERWTEAEQNGWQLVFDSYYNQLLDPERIPWGFLLTIVLISVFPVIREPGQLLHVMQVTRRGNKGLWKAKLWSVGLLCLFAAIVYTGAEYFIVTGFCPFQKLAAPVQSISVLSGVGCSVSIGAWLWLRAVCSIVAGVLAGEILFAVQYSIRLPAIRFQGSGCFTRKTERIIMRESKRK